MRILLQDNSTGYYFQGPDKWTRDPERGVDFRFIDRAIDYVETWGLRNVQLAFAFDDPPSVTTVPLEKTALQFSACLATRRPGFAQRNGHGGWLAS